MLPKLSFVHGKALSYFIFRILQSEPSSAGEQNNSFFKSQIRNINGAAENGQHHYSGADIFSASFF